MVQHYAAKVKFLQVELDDVFLAMNVQDRQFQSARKYYETGRSTKYHFRLPGYHNQHIKLLKDSQGNVVTSDTEILGVCHSFYNKLYTQENWLFFLFTTIAVGVFTKYSL